MEAIFKVPEGKPPFIGIIFSSEAEARLNSRFVDEGKGLRFIITSEIHGGKLGLRVGSDNDKFVYWYRDIICDQVAFRNWRCYIHNPLINFGHCYLKDGKHTVVRTEAGNLLVMKVSLFMFEL